MAPQTDKKKICVVLDTNIWLQHRLLYDPLGRSLLHRLEEINGLIALPEIVEREVRKGIKKRTEEEITKFKNSFAAIRQFLGLAPADPAQAFDSEKTSHGLGLKDFIQSFEARLQNLGGMMIQVPFSHAHAIAALSQVMEDLPPSGKNEEQFRDCAIWQSLLELGASYSIHFISNDSNFFKDPKSRKELADNLNNDCDRNKVDIAIHRELDSFLDWFPDTGRLEKPLKPLIQEFVKREALNKASQYGLKLGNLSRSTEHYYPTDDVGIFAVQFNYEYVIPEEFEINGKPIPSGTLSLSGSFSWDAKAKKPMDFGDHEYKIYGPGDSPELVEQGSVVLVTSAIITPLYSFLPPVRISE